MNSSVKSYGLIFLGAALWGGIGVFFRALSAEGFTPMQVVAIRAAVAGAVMAVFLAIKKPALLRIRLRDCWMFVGTGIISLVFFNWCYFSAIELSSMSVAAVLLYTSPIFVVLLSAPLFGERLTRRKLAALALTFAGCILVSGLLSGGAGAMSLKGLLLGVGSGFGYALYSIFGRYALRRYDTRTITLYTFLFATLAVVPFSGVIGMAPALLQPSNALSALGIGVLCTMLPYMFYTEGLSGVETGRAAILATVEPAVATILGICVFQEQLGPAKLLGMALIFASILLLNTRNAPAPAK